MQTTETFEPITKHETIDRKTVDMIIRHVGGWIAAMVVGLNNVDLSKGAGVIGPRTKCVWRKDGRRITISTASDGGVIASCSKGVDPDCPK